MQNCEGYYRYMRIQQRGKNASNHAHYLSLSGVELYGSVSDVYVDSFGKEPGRALYKIR